MNIGLFFLSSNDWQSLWSSFAGLIVVTQIVWLCSVVSVARNKTEDPFDRIVWLMVVLALNIIGTLLYLFFGAGVAQKRSSSHPLLPPAVTEDEVKRRANEGTLRGF